MAVQVSYPGVYIEEVPSGVRTIVGVGTSIAVFIGRTKLGPMNEPVLCLNYGGFERVFSSEYAGSDMARTIRLFFQNGGTQCYAVRIADGATHSQVTLRNEAGTDDAFTVTAKSPGVSGDSIRLAVTYNGLHPESTFNLEIFRWGRNIAGSRIKQDTEIWSNLSMDPNQPRFVETFINQNSKLVDIAIPAGSTPAASGYSRSGRAIFAGTGSDETFRNAWLSLMGTTGEVAYGSPWTSTSQITSAGTYHGLIAKTITFTIDGTDTLEVGIDEISITWNDGVGNSGATTVAETYTIDDPITVTQGVRLSFSTGNLVGGEAFTLTVSPTRNFRLSVDGGSFVTVDLSGLDFDTAPLNTHMDFSTNLAAAIQGIINTDFLAVGSSVTIAFETGPTGPAGQPNATTLMLQIESANGDVRIEPAAAFDLSARLMLGTAQGGVGISRYAQNRPAPTGVVFNIDNLVSFMQRTQNAFDTMTIGTHTIDLGTSLHTGAAPTTDRMYQDGFSPSITGNSDGVREKWTLAAEAVNDRSASDPEFRWSAELWGSRLALIPGDGGENFQSSIATSATNIGGNFTQNVRYYSLGPLGQGDLQTPAGSAASDGSAPMLSDYRDAFLKLDQEVDLFNLMILPSDEDHGPADTLSLWGPASVFCQKRRAFLLMDTPSSWGTVQQATHPATGVNRLRVGLVKDHAAIFYPRVTIKEDGLDKYVGPSGAIAGLMARIDSSRGVWKAPAGTEADLRGIVGLEYRYSDDENGVLNKRAVNALRIFPNGSVSWGARTMDGDDDFASEYKYIPVRRLALYLEESLYRGLKWVVFEPNDEPLWAQIRLNVGAFMHNLFRQGAFKGQKPSDAYFVKCDSETTTPTDINLGMVNIWVGFAPLKPAEFVVTYLQQMAGQIEV